MIGEAGLVSENALDKRSRTVLQFGAGKATKIQVQGFALAPGLVSAYWGAWQS